MKSTKYFWLVSPTQLFTQGQWWSIFRIQRLQTLKRVWKEGWRKERDEKVTLTLINNWKTVWKTVWFEDMAFKNIQLHVQGLEKIMWTLIITGVNIICVGCNENIAIIFNYPFCCHMHISVVWIVFSSSRGWNGRQIIRACLAGASVNLSAQLFGVW